ncbi:MAG: AAA family ATPase, partial [Planctomycetes bacterium]|nr:AAA family ATPase [Planctomycetota bacterium]
MTSTSTHTLPVAALRQAVCDRVRRVVASEPEVIETLLIAMVAGGHTLIEGIPGIGKTLLARTLARCVGCDFRRIQFTNDLMPSDIVGTAVWRPSRESFTFAKGPLFTNIVLADEINRTSPRTLSCLLEAMENGTASVEGRTMQLGEPFLVWATRNGIE